MTVPTLNGGMQPWNKVIFPGSESNYPLLPTMTPGRAKSLPAVGRVLGLIAGMIKQMPIEHYAGDRLLTRTRFLDQPDPDVARAWWVAVQVEDYLLNGNSVHYVTARDSVGWPMACTWVPADWVSITWSPDRRDVAYWVGGEQLDPRNVIHVRRGADRWCPYRGVGLVEQHLQQLGKVDRQEQYDRGVLDGSAVPSVVVITPNAEPSVEEIDRAKAQWVDKFGGPRREPGIFPAGTQVIPLTWSPHDSEMAEARKMSLQDVANMANLDGYWVGAPTSSLTYRSPAPMYLNLLRQTINPILEDFEGVWSQHWLPYGRKVRLDRTAVLKDDMSTMVTTAKMAVEAKLWTKSEARVYLGNSAEVPEELDTAPLPPALAAAAGTQDDTQDDDQEQDEEAS